MPTLNSLPGRNVPPLELPASSHLHAVLLSSHIYVALAAIVVLVAVRFATTRLWPTTSSCSKPWIRRWTGPKDQGHQPAARKDPAEHYYSKRNSPAPVHECSPAPGATGTGTANCFERDCYCSLAKNGALSPTAGFGFGQEHSPAQAQAVWAAGLLAPVVVRPGLLAGHQQQQHRHYQQRVMDGHDNGDHQQRRNPSGPGPATPPSRGVSILSANAAGLRRHDNNPSPTAAVIGAGAAVTRPGSHAGRRRSSSSRSPRSQSHASRSHSSSSQGKHRGVADGSDGTPSSTKGKELGIGPMDSFDTSAAAATSAWGRRASNPHTSDASLYADDAAVSRPAAFEIDFGILPRHFARPPPPPPLSPPMLSTSMFAFEDRRHGYAVSIPPDFEVDAAEFIRQPNPDYGGSTSGADIVGTTAAASDPKSAATAPRRRSYAKTIPVGIPVGIPIQGLVQDEQDSFSPSSYPPTSPLLPPPPPSHEFPYEFDGYGDAPGAIGAHGEIDLQGEIISVMDDAGHGWKRHTRVYGGGVCLACLSSGGDHGGFYGDTVPPEHKR